jgi:flagella basal body P-ring formation protein FlgA
MTIRTFAFATLLLAGLAGSAAAAPALRPEVMVTGPIVTIGDMFEEAGELAALPMFRAPLPGTSGIVGIEAVRQAAAAAGLKEFESAGLARVRVSRDATPVDEHVFNEMILTDLARRGVGGDGVVVQAMFDQTGLSFNAEATDNPVTLAGLRYMPGSGAFTARFLVAGRDAPVDLTGHVDLMVEAPHLVASLRAGSVLADGDIQMKLVPLKYAETSGVADKDDLIGKALLRQSRAGMMLRAADVGEPDLVARSEIVTVIFRNGALTLSVKGQALGGAALGESVDVLNLMSRKVLTGVAVGDGVVEILGGGQMTVAGL